MIRSVGAVPDEPVNLKDIVMTTSNLAETPVSPSPELEALKVRQRATWSSGNYAVVGTTLQIVGEQLGEALDLRSGQTVLDVAAGRSVTLITAFLSGADAAQRRREDEAAAAILGCSYKCLELPDSPERPEIRSALDNMKGATR